MARLTEHVERLVAAEHEKDRQRVIEEMAKPIDQADLGLIANLAAGVILYRKLEGLPIDDSLFLGDTQYEASERFQEAQLAAVASILPGLGLTVGGVVAVFVLTLVDLGFDIYAGRKRDREMTRAQHAIRDKIYYQLVVARDAYLAGLIPEIQPPEPDSQKWNGLGGSPLANASSDGVQVPPPAVLRLHPVFLRLELVRRHART